MLPLALDALMMFFAVQFIRALPLPAKWLEQKPLSCDVCMSGWAAIGLWLSREVNVHAAVERAGLTLLLLSLHGWLAPKLPSWPSSSSTGPSH